MAFGVIDQPHVENANTMICNVYDGLCHCLDSSSPFNTSAHDQSYALQSTWSLDEARIGGLCFNEGPARNQLINTELTGFI